MKGSRAVIHGAVSLVNAIATKKGATLGIGLRAEVTVEAVPGSGVSIVSESRSVSSRLINRTIERIVPGADLARNHVTVTLDSEIPAGYGLKSSSAISSAVALACARTFGLKMTDRQILLAGVDASIDTKVSITGAYDDACGCYYGGFNVTDNSGRRRIRHEPGPAGMAAVVFVPDDRRRKGLRSLDALADAFESAWDLAKDGMYWKAMTINGLATAPVLCAFPAVTSMLLEGGAVAASVSGNGPAVAAIAHERDVPAIRRVLSDLDGRVMVSGINNRKAEVHDL